MNTKTDTQKTNLSTATQQLLWVAASSPCLARIMGIEIEGTDGADGDGAERLIFNPHTQRPWLVPKYEGGSELTFEPDIFAKGLGLRSSGEKWMILWILNIWNPGYAETKAWRFDLFKAMSSLDSGNVEAIAAWLQNPIWP